MEYLKEFVITLTTISIFIVAIELILPDNSLKKYQNFVLSLIMMAVILTPIIKIFNSDISVAREIDKTINNIKKSYSEENQSLYTSNQSNLFIISKLEENCVLLLENKFDKNEFEVSIDGNIDLNTYDIDIKTVTVSIKDLGEEKKTEKIKVGNNNNIEDDTNISIDVKSILSKELNIDENIISIVRGE